jgi:hypothetical protein
VYYDIKGEQNMTFEQRLEFIKQYAALVEKLGSFLAANKFVRVIDFGNVCNIYKDKNIPVNMSADFLTIEGRS